MLGAIFQFFSVVGTMIAHTISSLYFFFTSIIPDCLSAIASVTAFAPNFLLVFISISLSLTIILGIFHLMPF